MSEEPTRRNRIVFEDMDEVIALLQAAITAINDAASVIGTCTKQIDVASGKVRHLARLMAMKHGGGIRAWLARLLRRCG